MFKEEQKNRFRSVVVNDRLKHKLSILPDQAGVYLLKNKAGKIIYVGKATSLKSRVRSYFSGVKDDLKTRKLVENVDDLDYIMVSNAHEALILEDTLIKKHKPKYNILLKDDKRYPFLKITAEQFPKLVVTREKIHDKGVYFGPFTDGSAMHRVKELAEEIFPFRKCNTVGKKRCLNYQIGKCSGVCEADEVGQQEYSQLIEQLKKFLTGQNRQLIGDLQERMEAVAQAMDYKKAAFYKMQLDSLQKLSQKQTVYFEDSKRRDVVVGYLEDDLGAIAVLKLIEGRLISKESYPLKNIKGKEMAEVMVAFLKQYYLPRLDELPWQILVELDLSQELDADLQEQLNLFVPQRGNLSKLLWMARQNAFDVVEQERLKYLRRSVRTSAPVLELKQALNLSVLPTKIICIDISTIQGSDTVASLVFFENGKPKKKNYMHFKMEEVVGQDDFASMQETLRRYLGKLDQYEKPDLIVVDGGKGQLSSSVEILEEMSVDIPIVSLAKRLEEVFLPNQSESILLPRKSLALKMIVHLRDEAHRFAITYHRKRRSMRTLTSELDKVVGEQTKYNLLCEFGSVQGVREATVDELQRVKGVGEAVAKKVKGELGEK